jgi:uncharacterized membrane protein YhaH (DUF805 family)
MIGFGEAVSRFYRNYFNFSGRASRAEYWWPVLMQTIVYIGLIIVFFVMVEIGEQSVSENIGGGVATLLVAGLLFILLNIIPSYAVAARRFHDLDQTAWLVLVFVIANAFIFISIFAQLIWFAMPGTDGPNQYGPDPSGSEADIFG